MCLLRTVHDRRQQVPPFREPECRQHHGVIGAAAIVAKSEARLGRIGRALAGQLEVEKILAVHRRRRTPQQRRPLAREPQQLRGLLARGQSGAGAGKGRACGAALAQLFDQGTRARVQPQPGRCDRRAIGIEEPGAVALRRDRQGRDLARRQPRREFREHVGRIVPGARHVLLDRAARAGGEAVRTRCAGDRAAGRGERDRLDDRGAGIERQQQHLAHAGIPPCSSARPEAASNRCTASGATVIAISVPVRAAIRWFATATMTCPPSSSATCA